MRKLFFTSVLVVTVALGGVLAYSIWKAAPATSQAYFDSGKKYYDEKKYPEATIQLLNAVRKDPRNRDARYFLALAFVGQRDIVQSAAQLRALLEYYPDDVPANLQLGNIYLTAGRTSPDLFRQAQEIARKVLAKEPNNVGALLLSGNAAAGLQDYSTSVDFFEKALSLDPQNSSIFVSLGTSQTLQKNYAEAEQAFLKAQQISPKEKTVLLSLANYYRALKQNDKAEAVFKNGISLFPGDRQIYIPLADFYNQNGRFDDAVKVLRDAQTSSPQDPEPLLILSDLYNSKDRRADGRKVLLEVKDKFPKNLDVSVKVALNFLQDQPERARAEVDQIMKQDPKSPIGPVLLGELQFLAGQYDAAEATLGKPPAVDSPYPQVQFFLGNIEMKKGQPDQAIFHYQKALAVSSAYLPARVALAEVFLQKGRLDDSRQEIQKALDTRSDYGPARLLKATLDATDKNNKNAEQELTALAKDQPENAMVYRQTGIYDESRGKMADAEKNLLHALELQPNSQQFLRDLTLFYIRQKQADRAILRINTIPDDKKEAFHYELLGLAYSQAGKTQEAENAYKKALQKDPAHSNSDVYLFAQYLKDGHLEDGLKAIDDYIKNHPQGSGAYSAKALVLQTQGKIQEAKQNYEQELKLSPDSEFAANNLAYILAEEGTDLNAALGYAQTARKKAPQSPEIADTLGWVYYKLGSYVLAQEQFRFAIAKQPDNGAFQYHLGMAAKAMKQTNEAVAALKKAANSKNDFKEKSLAQAALKEMETR
jgi:tetratricopeptide (TPR) repeat protein